MFSLCCLPQDKKTCGLLIKGEGHSRNGVFFEIANNSTEILLQIGPKFNTARRHFESYLAAWLLVHDVISFNETSGRVTWDRSQSPRYPTVSGVTFYFNLQRMSHWLGLWGHFSINLLGNEFWKKLSVKICCHGNVKHDGQQIIISNCSQINARKRRHVWWLYLAN